MYLRYWVSDVWLLAGTAYLCPDFTPLHQVMWTLINPFFPMWTLLNLFMWMLPTRFAWALLNRFMWMLPNRFTWTLLSRD
jgi:hypothetical protein